MPSLPLALFDDDDGGGHAVVVVGADATASEGIAEERVPPLCGGGWRSRLALALSLVVDAAFSKSS